MTQARREAIDARLDELPAPALKPFIAALGNVGAALFNVFGDPRGRPTVERAVDALWAGAPPKTSKELSKGVRALPEMKATDSHRPDYHAGVGLDFVRRALQISAAPDEAKQREDLKVLAYDVRSEMDGYDFALTGKEARIKVPNQPPVPGGLEDVEIARQLAALDRLAAGAGSAAAQAIQEDARRFADRVERTVAPFRSMLAARYGT